jgi:SAM-dependent methyltransferase
LILLLLGLYIIRFEYDNLAGNSNETGNGKYVDFAKLLDIELTKRLANEGSASAVTKLEELVELLTRHLEHHKNDSIKISNLKAVEKPCSCPLPVPCPAQVAEPIPVPCPAQVAAPIPVPCPNENKPPYFSKLGHINRKLDIGNPDTRDAWIKNKAEKLCHLSSNFSILDVSAGNKPYQHLWIKAGCKYFSNEFGGNVEIVDNFRGESKKNDLASKHDYIGTDITNTGAPSNSFDVAVLTEVLEHLPEPALSIPELVRVTKPGGHILITAPFTSGSHQLPYHFSSGYPREWYQYVAKKNNLEVVEIESQGDYFKLMAQEFVRAMTCEPDLPEADPIFLKEMKDVVPFHFLMRSEKFGKGSCGNQFTIGFMALTLAD